MTVTATPLSDNMKKEIMGRLKEMRLVIKVIKELTKLSVKWQNDLLARQSLLQILGEVLKQANEMEAYLKKNRPPKTKL